MKFRTNISPDLKHLLDLPDDDIEQLMKTSKALKQKLNRKVDARDILSREVNNLSSIASEIDSKINILRSIPDETRVSDHAVIRYLERVMGINVDDLLRKNILTDEVKAKINKVGDCKIPIDNEMYIIVRNNTIVSIVPINK